MDATQGVLKNIPKGGRQLAPIIRRGDCPYLAPRAGPPKIAKHSYRQIAAASAYRAY